MSKELVMWPYLTARRLEVYFFTWPKWKGEPAVDENFMEMKLFHIHRKHFCSNFSLLLNSL
jgi:hypothetical protein